MTQFGTNPRSTSPLARKLAAEHGGPVNPPAVRCPCCGREMPDSPRLDEIAIACRLTGNVKRLFWILASARGAYLPYLRLAEILWLDDPDGGPELTQKNIATTIHLLRNKIARYPVAIEAQGSSRPSARIVFRWAVKREPGGLGYQLVKVAA